MMANEPQQLKYSFIVIIIDNNNENLYIVFKNVKQTVKLL